MPIFFLDFILIFVLFRMMTTHSCMRSTNTVLASSPNRDFGPTYRFLAPPLLLNNIPSLVAFFPKSNTWRIASIVWVACVQSGV